jgi:hypothetical protein
VEIRRPPDLLREATTLDSASVSCRHNSSRPVQRRAETDPAGGDRRHSLPPPSPVTGNANPGERGLWGARAAICLRFQAVTPPSRPPRPRRSGTSGLHLAPPRRRGSQPPARMQWGMRESTGTCSTPQHCSYLSLLRIGLLQMQIPLLVGDSLETSTSLIPLATSLHLAERGADRVTR